MKKSVIFIALFSLTLIAFLLRVLPFNYSLRPIAASDTYNFTQALNLGQALSENNLSFFKIPAAYPHFLSYLFLGLFFIYYLIGYLGGVFLSLADFSKYSIIHLEYLFELSRITIALLGTLLVPLVYLTTRRLILSKYQKNNWTIICSLMAASLMTFSLLHIHFAKVVKTHVPAAFFIFLSFYCYLILIKNKNWPAWLILGLSSGLAAATLQNGFLAITFLCSALFFLLKTKSQSVKKIFWQFITALIIFILIAATGYPYLVLAPTESLNLKSGHPNFTFSGNQYYTEFIDQLAMMNGQGFLAELKGLIFYDPAIILLILIFSGCLIWVRTKNPGPAIKSSIDYSASFTGALIFLTTYLILFGIYSGTYYRLLSPLIPFLCFLTGILIFELLNQGGTKQRKWLLGFFSLVLIFPISQWIRLNDLTIRRSTEELATEWLMANAKNEEIIALEGHSHLNLIPSLPALTKRVKLINIESLGQRDKLLLSLNKEDYPQNTLPVIPLFVFSENNEALQNFLKTEADYLVTGSYTAKPLTDPINQIISNIDKKLVLEFNPFKNNAISDSLAIFPQELKNPLLDLWRYQRMGPIIKIYKIQP